MILGRLRDWLTEPRVRSLDVDGPAFSLAHREVLMSKPMLRKLFARFYESCREVDRRYFGDCPGRRIDIGSGSSFIREIYPDTLTSDIKVLPFVDLALRVEQMPFPANSLRAVYAINVFHHLPDPRTFFAEMLRVLHPGGGIVLIEPYYGPVARYVFKRLHASERFDPEAPDWRATNTTGPLSSANQALSYIVFRRDRVRFQDEWPALSIVAEWPHTHLWYLASGGVNFRQLLPAALMPLAVFAERALSPFNKVLALQQTIVLQKVREVKETDSRARLLKLVGVEQESIPAAD